MLQVVVHSAARPSVACIQQRRGGGTLEHCNWGHQSVATVSIGCNVNVGLTTFSAGESDAFDWYSMQATRTTACSTIHATIAKMSAVCIGTHGRRWEDNASINVFMHEVPRATNLLHVQWASMLNLESGLHGKGPDG